MNFYGGVETVDPNNCFIVMYCTAQRTRHKETNFIVVAYYFNVSTILYNY